MGVENRVLAQESRVYDMGLGLPLTCLVLSLFLPLKLIFKKSHLQGASGPCLNTLSLYKRMVPLWVPKLLPHPLLPSLLPIQDIWTPFCKGLALSAVSTPLPKTTLYHWANLNFGVTPMALGIMAQKYS